jgi:phospholipase/carboxylesterase
MAGVNEPPALTRTPSLTLAAGLAIACLWTGGGCDARGAAAPGAAATGRSTEAEVPPETRREPESGPGEAAGVRFIELLTGGAKPGERLPLVVAIHGLGDRPEAFAPLFAGLPAKARVIVPFGLEPWSSGFSWFELSSGDQEKLARGTKHASDRLAAMIEELSRRRPTEGKAIATGFSQGGMLSFTLAVLHPEAVRAAVPVSGMLAKPLWPTAWPIGMAMPVVHALHGDADERVPVQAARAAVKRLAEGGLSADLREYAGVGHTVSPEMRADLSRALANLASAR